MVGVRRAGPDGRLGGSADPGIHGKPIDFEYVGSGGRFSRGGRGGSTQRPGWSTDTSRTDRRRRRGHPVSEAVATYGEGCNGGSGGRSTSSASALSSGWAIGWLVVVDDEPSFALDLPRRAPVGGRGRAAVDDAQQVELARSSPMPVRPRSWSPMSSQLSSRTSRRASPSDSTTSVVTPADASVVALAMIRCRSTPGGRVAPGPPLGLGLAGVLALHSVAPPAVPKGVVHQPRQPPATYDTYARRCSTSAPTTGSSPLPSSSSPTARNSLTFPFAGGSDGDPRPRPTDATSGRRAPHRGAAHAVLLQPRASSPPARFRSPAVDLRFGPGHCHRGRGRSRPTSTAGSPTRFGRRCSTASARPRRSHLHLEHAPSSAGGQWPASCPATGPSSATTAGRVTEAETPGVPPRAGVDPQPSATGSARRDRRIVPRCGVAAHRRRLHPRRRPTWTFLGRNNDMIKAGGIWVSPAEVESALVGRASVGN